jgi:signal transduction histidine kinase
VRPPAAAREKVWTIVAILALIIGVSDYLAGGEVSFSIFYLVPISLATTWRGPVAGVSTALGTTLVRILGDWLSFYPEPLPLHTMWNVGAALVIFIFVVWLLHSLVTLHRRLEGKVAAQKSELIESAADRHRLELEVLDVSTRERSAFGRELHDELGQHFVATAMAAQVLAQKLDDPTRAAEARAIVHWIEDGIAKTRKLARGLLLARIEPERLPQELEELAVASSRAGVQCRIASAGLDFEADATECAQLFRIAQEAVGNALRHGHPRSIAIALDCDEEGLTLTIEDDGAGFQPARAPGQGMGLRIMQHRATLIGASLSVVSSPGEGTTIFCRLPRRVRQLV